MQNFDKTRWGIEEGAIFKRSIGGSMTETAEIVEIGQDRMGIPHVRFNTLLLRGGYAASASEQRTLSVESFCSRFRERVQR